MTIPGQRVPLRAILPLAFTLVMLTATLVFAAPPAGASAGSALFNQAQARYTASDYAGAARLYEQAVQAGYATSTLYFKLGLAFSHLRQWDGVVWAMQTLQQKDPAYARDHALVAQRLIAAQAHGGANNGMPPLAAIGVGGATVGSGSGSSSGPGPGSVTDRQVADALRLSDVYVAPSMAGAVGAGGVASLASDAAALRNGGTPAKYAILSAAPRPYATLGQFTEALFSSLALKHAVLVAVTPQGVSAWTDRLSRDKVATLVGNSRPQFLNGTYVGGATALAHSVVDQANAADTASSTGRTVLILLVLLVVAAILAIFVLTRWGRWQRGYREAMGWRDAVAALENELSTDVQYLPAGDPRQRAFAAGAEYYGKAAAGLDRLGKQSPFSVAFGGGPLFRTLGEARLNLQEAEAKLREAGATGPGIGAAGAAALPVSQAGPGGAGQRAYRDANPIAPTPAQAACFFCGKPLDPATAEAVVVPVGNQQRRVLVCQEHGTAVQRGQQPEVRSFMSPSMGRSVPWWAAPEYSPYRDYDPYYYRRGGGIGWGDLLLYDALFNRPTTNVIYVDDDRWGDGGGYGGYAPGGFSTSPGDAGSFDSGTRDMPAAPEASFDYSGGSGGGSDRS